MRISQRVQPFFSPPAVVVAGELVAELAVQVRELTPVRTLHRLLIAWRGGKMHF